MRTFGNGTLWDLKVSDAGALVHNNNTLQVFQAKLGIYYRVLT